MLMTLGDDRAVRQTYIAGRPVLLNRRARNAGTIATDRLKRRLPRGLACIGHGEVRQGGVAWRTIR